MSIPGGLVRTVRFRTRGCDRPRRTRCFDKVSSPPMPVLHTIDRDLATAGHLLPRRRSSRARLPPALSCRSRIHVPHEESPPSLSCSPDDRTMASSFAAYCLVPPEGVSWAPPTIGPSLGASTLDLEVDGTLDISVGDQAISQRRCSWPHAPQGGCADTGLTGLSLLMLAAEIPSGTNTYGMLL